MKETYQCPAGGCDHPPLKTPQPRRSHTRNIHSDLLEEKGLAEDVIVGKDSAILLNRLG